MDRYNSPLQLAFIVIACSMLFACGEVSPVLGPGSGSGTSGNPPTTSPARTPLSAPIAAGALTPPPGKIYFGAYPNTSGLANGNNPGATAALENDLGRPLALHMQYMDFGEDIDGLSEQDDYQHFRVSVLSLNCIAPDVQIASGKFDSTISLIASQAVAYKWPLFIRYSWDPNMPAGSVHPKVCYDPKTDEPNNVFSPAEYVAAWKHLHDMFAAAGAVNVVWLWSVSSSSLAIDPMQYYPGSAYVDWVGIDAYDVNNAGFAGTFSSLYAELAPLAKPIMVSETGALPNQQGSFFNAGVSALKSQFPGVEAFLYYDSISYVPGQNDDWRIVPPAFAAFSNFANDPYLSAVYGE